VQNLVCVPSRTNLTGEVYTLSFITSTGKLYQVEFDPFYLHEKTKVKVNGPISLDISGSSP
jgi:hypothetical protein